MCVCVQYLRSPLANYVVIFGRVRTGRTWLGGVEPYVCARVRAREVRNIPSYTRRCLNIENNYVGRRALVQIYFYVPSKYLAEAKFSIFAYWSIEYSFCGMTADRSRAKTEKKNRVKNICREIFAPIVIRIHRISLLSETKFISSVHDVRTCSSDFDFFLFRNTRSFTKRRTPNTIRFSFAANWHMFFFSVRIVSHRRSWRHTLCVYLKMTVANDKLQLDTIWLHLFSFHLAELRVHIVMGLWISRFCFFYYFIVFHESVWVRARASRGRRSRKRDINSNAWHSSRHTKRPTGRPSSSVPRDASQFTSFMLLIMLMTANMCVRSFVHSFYFIFSAGFSCISWLQRA